MKHLKYLFSLLLVLITFNLSAQDFHTANIKVDYEQETGTLNITARTFTNQLEKAVGADVSNKSNFENKLKSYVNSKVDVKVNGKALGTSYYGYQVNDKSTRVFFKFDKISDISSIELRVALLTDIFNDQQNIVTFDVKNKKDTKVLTGSNDVVKLSF
ncbi:hypothetical protein HX001_10295 [Empedobacter brevis]|uniref:Uncharacterized protein n=2 Tax=Empedobacter brevis TaxID=247 RepID=A0A511NKM1_9FLAO|nr:DUF6702 family protein [Empedobacter brevis]MDM1072876.1 hypothetical protein [Empedobacter brevis]QES91804.1 hypothetical protein F0358_03260 [Empedobacter brevis]QHC83568.1 hypothetical protein AS589_01540 [Empedobacter brevis]GEM52791.1 hypothetical protein EB1_25810 [Empedobacter brevis NBRC 14943 = ATCC 43319]